MPTGVYKRTKLVWNKGKKLSKSHRKALSKSWNYEKHITDKLRESAKRTAIKYLHTEEIAKKISKSLTGKKLSKQHRENLRISRLGRNAGENHWNWKGGITRLNHAIRNLDKYKQWIKVVFKRDNYTCQKCGQIGGKLEVHHIISFAKLIKKNNIRTLKQAINCKELWNITNGITYCTNCHIKVDGYRNRVKKI